MQHNLKTTHNFYPLALNEPGAWVGHLPFAHWLVSQLKPDLLVELGTHTGNSYFAMCQAVRDNELATHCIAVDTWQGDEHAGIYDDSVYTNVNTYNNIHYSSFSKLMRMTFDEALEHIEDHSVELLHIDGLHTYEAVKHDFDSWLIKLKPNAIVIFHDTCVFELNFGVYQLWEELTKRYPLNYNFTNSHGLGVLCLGEQPPENICEFFTKSKERDAFTASLANYGESLINNLKGKAQITQQQRQLAELSQKNTELDKQLNQLQLNYAHTHRLTLQQAQMIQNIERKAFPLKRMFKRLKNGVKKRLNSSKKIS